MNGIGRKFGVEQRALAPENISAPAPAQHSLEKKSELFQTNANEEKEMFRLPRPTFSYR